MYYGP
jgi:MFS family permease